MKKLLSGFVVLALSSSVAFAQGEEPPAGGAGTSTPEMGGAGSDPMATPAPAAPAPKKHAKKHHASHAKKHHKKKHHKKHSAS